MLPLLLLVFGGPTLFVAVMGHIGVVNDVTVSTIAAFWLLGVLVQVLYFIPLIVALHREHRQTLAIGILNFFAGWTFIGWIACLVWACTQPAPVVVMPFTLPKALPEALPDAAQSRPAYVFGKEWA